ncbi:hypothetical protein CR513_55060, partial [Mucuna pruriens]
MKYNGRAIYLITCALSKYEYKKFYSYRTTKETWNIIAIKHKAHVKKRKITTLTRHYETFIMKYDESINNLALDELLGYFNVHEVHLRKRNEITLNFMKLNL